MVRQILQTDEEKSFRYELKYHFSQVSKAWLQSRILQHPALFYRLYSPRWVNTLYWDSPDLRAYESSINGVSPRCKVRMRWYGDTFGTVEPVLELKIKKGNRNRKQLYRLSIFDMQEEESLAVLRQRIMALDGLDDFIRNELKTLRPVLLVRYFRSYYRSGHLDARITLDQDLQCASFLRDHRIGAPRVYLRGDCIMEIKFEKNRDQISEMVQGFRMPLQMSRMSKFTTGLELCRG